MANTFKALSDLADWQKPASPVEPELQTSQSEEDLERKSDAALGKRDNKGADHLAALQLHYNIQIHLPESRDPAVFDAIFQSLRKHIV
jgi:hypothetical protein